MIFRECETIIEIVIDSGKLVFLSMNLDRIFLFFHSNLVNNCNSISLTYKLPTNLNNDPFLNQIIINECANLSFKTEKKDFIALTKKIV